MVTVDKRLFLVFMAITGLMLGIAGYSFIPAEQKGDTYCEKIEQGIRENRSIEGPLNCFAPSNFDQKNLSEVENATDLQCLCEYNLNGERRVLAIRETQ